MDKKPKRLYCIACEVLFREICHHSALSPNLVDHKWISQGLHDQGGEKMAARIQAEIDAVPADKYDAIVLGYALCNNGVVGLKPKSMPLVIPKAHDCITFFLGSAARYLEVFNDNPGTYFLTSGWLERDEKNLEDIDSPAKKALGMDKSMEELIAEYGEENADYIAETLGGFTKHYNRFGFIEIDYLKHLPFAEMARAQAEKRGWELRIIPGDTCLLQRLVDGEWNEDSFLVVNPGQEIQSDIGGQILACRDCGKCAGK